MPVIVLEGDHWHHGVIGIVSSRITEKFYRPSILISFEGGMLSDEPSPEDVGKGSGRSIKGLNLVDALCDASEHLVKFGGHELAAGLSVTRGELPAFRERINRYAASVFSGNDLVPTVEADCEVRFCDLTIDFADSIGILEPFGVGNPIPTFVMRDIPISEISGVGEGKHSRIVFTDGTAILTGMYFSMPPSSLPVAVGDLCDVLFHVDINEYLGRRTVQIIVRDIRPSERQIRADRRERERFSEIWSGEPFSEDENVLPTHDDFAAVYRLILASVRSGVDVLSHKEILSGLPAYTKGAPIGYIKLKVIMKIFHEMNIMNIEEREEEVYRFRVQYTTGKTDLEKSGLLRRLRAQQRSSGKTDDPS